MIIKRVSYFSDGEKKRAVRLGDIQSHRGRGRAAVLGAIVPGMVGGYIGKKKAEDLDDEGKSDAEILRGSRKTGAIAGAVTGAGLGLGIGRSVGRGLFGVATGALGGYLGSDKNTRTRLKKRKEMEERLNG